MSSQPLYKVDDKLVLAAPVHTGLPSGGNVVVRRVRYDDMIATWVYDVMIYGGGKHGSDVRPVDGVREGWLRHEGRIATAKVCAPLAFSALARLAPRMLVPLYQRRYCWDELHWQKLWSDVVSSPPALGQSHSIGRVTIARESRAIVLIDGQQRCTTLMLMLCALRDVARELGEEAAKPLVDKINAVLTTRPSKLQRRGDDGSGGSGNEAQHTKHATVGLESLDGMDSLVRLIPSREDRLPYCRLVLELPVDRTASKAAAKMSECYSVFQSAATALVAGRSSQVGEILGMAVENVLARTSLVVFELQDGVALQTMYDMLAQRERAIIDSRQFAHIGGHKMSEVDLVRNLLLNSIADEDEKYRAYDDFWVPMERARGDGDAATLEAFMRAFVERDLEPCGLLEGISKLLGMRGGAAGVASLHEHGTAAADAAAAVEVDVDGPTRAALALLQELRDVACVNTPDTSHSSCAPAE